MEATGSWLGDAHLSMPSPPDLLEDATFQCEVRGSEPRAPRTTNTTIRRCQTCKKDRKMCTRKEANQAKCDRCLKYNYTCAVDDISTSIEGKRRKLQRMKCESCRSAKVKCEPTDRVWPAHCNRCIEKHLPCSMPQLSRTFLDVVNDVHSPRSSYKYAPLKDDEFRLLIVHPGEGDEDLTCSLIIRSLQNSPQYEALSYLWGSDPENNLIRIISYNAKSKHSLMSMNYSKMYTRSNLYKSLQQLRQRKEPVMLFVTALCIDCNNPNEKYYQASRTQEIFHRASDVIIWLGEKTATSEKAFEFIPQILDLQSFESLLKDDLKTNYWIALAELMRNSLFGRRWLIQELAVAKNATIRCGEDVVSWSDFTDAVLLFETNILEIRRFFTPSYMASGGPMDDINVLAASKLVKVVNNLVRKTSDEKILNRLVTLESLVSSLTVFEATDPLDTINAIIGLAKDQAQLQSIKLRIDNNEGVLEVFTAFVEYCVLSGSIDIICRHWAPEMREPAHVERIRGAVSTKIRLPSWMPTISGSAFGTFRDNLNGRVNGDSFVGLPDDRIYNAAFGFPFSNPHFSQHMMDTGTMDVSGYVLDTIAELGTRAAQGLIIRESLEMGGWTIGAEIVPERLWRTLVADRGPNNTNAPSWYKRACLHCLEQSDMNGDFNTFALLNQPHCPDNISAFLRRVQSVIWNRKFLLSKLKMNGDRLFGLAPADTKVGDLICILYGCSVPVILREHKTQDDHYFEVVGESFVYGMMQGEARESLSDEEVAAKTVLFKLR